MGKEAEWIVIGSELSPYTLKVLSLFARAGLPHRLLPVEGSTLENLRLQRRLRAVKKGRLPLTWPEMTDLDEFPLVPFVFGHGGENLYDSSAIAQWLDRQGPLEGGGPPFYPGEDPSLRFVAWLIDEYADEFGLYMAHHYRWKISAADNDAGERLARELRSLAGPFRPIVARRFSARQVRRLPYLFSVAPEGFRIEGLPARLQPPARKGFPATHELLEESFTRLLAALEPLLASRPWVLGERFTAADASLYGQLAINLDDPSAARFIRARAPVVFSWVQRVRSAELPDARGGGRLALDGALSPLLEEICRTYLPLMKQNFGAYLRYRRAGETLFNEAAFDRHRQLYDGDIDGRPFRSVVKTFQVKTWLNVRRLWCELEEDRRRRLEDLCPSLQGMREDS